jgi:DNA invertase Pin-like site-specific DNA recombinase
MNGKAYSYIRFSSPEQAKGSSYERQRQACENYCAEHGLALADEPEYKFFDRGRSAYKGDHIGEKGQLARFIDLVDRDDIKPGSTLIVESLDRMSRQSVTKALPWFLGLVDKGIRVVTLNDGKVYDREHLNELDLILSIFVLSRAHNESSTKAKRLAFKFKEKREKAATELKPMGNVCPMWLRLKDDGSGYEPIPVYVKAVERIFTLTLEGYGKQSIARTLNAEGFPTFKERQGVQGWGVSSVHHVVKNRAVLGEWQPYTKTLDPERKKRERAGNPIPNYFPPIIGEDVFNRAQAAVAGRKTARATKQSPNFNIWQGVGKCLHCGSPMHIVNKGTNKERQTKGTTYIECSVGRKKVPGVCESYKLIRLDDSERVFRLVLARLDSMPLVKDSGAKLAKELSAVEGQMAQERQKLDGYEKLMTVAASERLARLMQASEAELGRLELERQRLSGELAAEDAIGFNTFMERLNLESHGGRFDANALLKRLGVLVFASQEGFIVSQQGRIIFGVGCENVGTGKRWKTGRVGYLELNPWKRQAEGEPLHVAAGKALKAAAPLHFVLPTEAGALAFALEEDADQARYEAIEDEGHAVHYP